MRAGCVDVMVAGAAIRVLFRADPLSVRRTLVTLRDGLERQLGDCDLSNFELVLAEVLNNVVEHAYGGSGEGIVDLRVAPAPAALAVWVADTGRAFPAGAPPLHDFPPAGPGDAPEGGYGWPLIRALSLGLCYRREGGRNILSFHMPLEQAASRGQRRQG